MKWASRLLLAAAFYFPAAVIADVDAGDLPADTVWYLHADLQQMRSAESGSPLYDWFDKEVLIEINDELGIVIDDEVDAITAFSDEGLGTVIVVDGRMSREFREELLERVRDTVSIREFDEDGKTYYFAGDREDDRGRKDNSDPFDDFDDALYFSLAVDRKLLVTSHRDEMLALLERGGRITGSGSTDGAMFVLTADKSFVQAGLRPDGLADDDDDGWESNIIRNTEQAALLISDSNGRIAVEAQLTSADPVMAQSIGGIVNGLISLQMFNSELDADLKALIQNTRVSVRDNLLSISTIVDPALVLSLIDE